MRQALRNRLRIFFIISVIMMNAFVLFGQSSSESTFMCNCMGNIEKNFEGRVTYRDTLIDGMKFKKIRIINNTWDMNFYYLGMIKKDSLFFTDIFSDKDSIINIPDSSIFISSFNKKEKRTIKYDYDRTILDVGVIKGKIEIKIKYLTYSSHSPYLISLIIDRKYGITYYHYFNGYLNFDCSINKKIVIN